MSKDIQLIYEAYENMQNNKNLEEQLLKAAQQTGDPKLTALYIISTGDHSLNINHGHEGFYLHKDDEIDSGEGTVNCTILVYNGDKGLQGEVEIHKTTGVAPSRGVPEDQWEETNTAAQNFIIPVPGDLDANNISDEQLYGFGEQADQIISQALQEATDELDIN